MHKEELDVADVVDEESLVAGGHHVAGLLVGSETDRGHNHLSLEASSHAVVDTLGLSPARVDTHEGVTLMSVEAVRPCKNAESVLQLTVYDSQSSYSSMQWSPRARIVGFFGRE